MYPYVLVGLSALKPGAKCFIDGIALDSRPGIIDSSKLRHPYRVVSAGVRYVLASIRSSGSFDCSCDCEVYVSAKSYHSLYKV